MTTNPGSEPQHQPERGAACPSCGAAVVTGVSWCSLCFASLLPLAPEAEPTPPAAERPEAGLAASEVDAIADRMLAELAATHDPGAGWTARLPQTGGGKAGFIVGAVVVGALLLVALMTVLGLFL